MAKAEFGDGFVEKFAYDAAKNTAGVALQGPGLDASVSKLFAWRSTPGGVVQLARGPNGETVALTHDLCGRVVERRVDRKGEGEIVLGRATPRDDNDPANDNDAQAIYPRVLFDEGGKWTTSQNSD